jgi:hypothetical protein
MWRRPQDLSGIFANTAHRQKKKGGDLSALRTVIGDTASLGLQTRRSFL